MTWSSWQTQRPGPNADHAVAVPATNPLPATSCTSRAGVVLLRLRLPRMRVPGWADYMQPTVTAIATGCISKPAIITKTRHPRYGYWAIISMAAKNWRGNHAHARRIFGDADGVLPGH